MTVLKWLLIIFGVLFIAFMAVVIGGYYWASTVESVKLNAADMEVGGPYPSDERQALLGACQKSGVAGADTTACTCVADKAGTEASRFERLMVTAVLEANATMVMALTKGLIASGVSAEKVEAMDKDSKGRIDGLLKSCGLEHK
jgi:hypothetical protein